jgi:Tfp pilus assembly PilM family ATPase
LARFLALDWDHKQLHLVVATTGRQGPRVQRALVWQEENDPAAGQPEALGKRLREHLKTAGIAGAPVLACLGRDRVIVKEIRYPQVPPSEETAVVRFQASKELTDAAEDVVIDYWPLNEPGAAGERRAVAVIVRRSLVAAYQTLCKAAGLKLVALTPRPFGVAASLERVAGVTERTPAPQSPEAVSAILTVAEGWAEFCIVRGSTLLFARALAVGANLAGEVRRNLAVYAGQPQVSLARDVVRALYVAGNGEQADLRERLQELLAIPVHPLDPFAPDAGADLAAGDRAGFTGAAGLLQLWAPRHQAPVNFVHAKEPVKVADKNRNRKLLVAAAAAVLVLLGGIWGYQAVAGRRAEIESLSKEKSDWQLALDRLAPDAKNFQALRDWKDTSIRWIDELYDLTARFPYRDGMRITQLSATTVTTSRNTKDKEKATVRVTINGIAPGEDDRLVLDMVDLINHDPHAHASAVYIKPIAAPSGQPQPGPRKTFKEFSIRVDLTRQSAWEYTTVLVPPANAPAPRARPAVDGEDDDIGALLQGGVP